LLLTFGLNQLLFGQNLSELQNILEEAQTTEEKISGNFDLGKALLPRDAESSAMHSGEAFKLASQIGANASAAKAAFQAAEAYTRMRNRAQERFWFNQSLIFAKRAGDSELVLRSASRLSALEGNSGSYQQAFQILDDTFDYLEDQASSTPSGSSEAALRRNFAQEQEIQQLKNQVRSLRREIRSLRAKAGEEGPEEESTFESDESDLEGDANLFIPGELMAFDTIPVPAGLSPELADEAERLSKIRSPEYKQLTKVALAQEAVVQEARANLGTGGFPLPMEEIQLLMVGATIVLVLLALVALILISRFRKFRKQIASKDRQIEEEKIRSEELLLQILPAELASDFSPNGKPYSKSYPEASILRCHFSNLDQLSMRLQPDQLVGEIDTCFRSFDLILSQYPELEKIKTSGGTYLCASGLTDKKTLPNDLIRAALEMQAFLDEHKEEKGRLGLPSIEARIGIHTGPVIAGVVGMNKFGFDLWGEAVDTALQVESRGRTGQVNISESTYGMVRYRFDCSFQGRVNSREKGSLDTYSVQGEKTAELQKA
jgi:class 3 adenylate cyclase